MFEIGDLVRHKPTNDYGFVIEILNTSICKVCWFPDLRQNWVVRSETIEKVS